MLKKEAIRKVQTPKGTFVSNLFRVKRKMRAKNQWYISSNWMHNPILPLQNVRFAKFEIHVVKRRLHVQSRLKRCIFFSFFGKRFEAICLVSLIRKLVRVPLPLLWFGTSITNIHNIFKSANYNLTQDKHQNYNLFRLHCIDWSLFKEILMRRDTVISQLQHLGFVINWKKCVLTPVEKIDFLAWQFTLSL